MLNNNRKLKKDLPPVEEGGRSTKTMVDIPQVDDRKQASVFNDRDRLVTNGIRADERIRCIEETIMSLRLTVREQVKHTNDIL